MNVLVYVGQRLPSPHGPAVRRHRPGGAARDVHPGGRSVQMLVLTRADGIFAEDELAPERRLLTRWTANLGTIFVVASVTGIVHSARSRTSRSSETSLSSRGGHSAAYVVVMCIVAFFILLGLWFHVWYAKRRAPSLASCRTSRRAWPSSPRMRRTSSSSISTMTYTGQCMNQIVAATSSLDFIDLDCARKIPWNCTITSSPGSARSSAPSTIRRRSSAWPSRREFLYKV